MTTVSDILAFLETLAPSSMKMDWDNCGLLCGSASSPVTKILVALDPFEDVCREAAELGAELIVTHHPLIFNAPRAVTDETALGRSIQLLCRNGISAVNAHTNLDCADGGVNDVLAAALGLSQVEVIGSEHLLRAGFYDAPLPDFLAHVKRALHCQGLRYAAGGRPVHRVAVGGGACGGELMEACAAGCDTFVTADVKYNQFRDAADLGINLIDAGHFPTENPVVAVLAEKIAAAFPEVQVKISPNHRDCVNFF
ncbi:MAG: Nif3-like dinuclear metal center hexameric protein [Eubacteriales bacterium]|nr:Nif3-like dinuclear metal center hexameric protein [Eubacteriales bacterium]